MGKQEFGKDVGKITPPADTAKQQAERIQKQKTNDPIEVVHPSITDELKKKQEKEQEEKDKGKT